MDPGKISTAGGNSNGLPELARAGRAIVISKSMMVACGSGLRLARESQPRGPGRGRRACQVQRSRPPGRHSAAVRQSGPPSRGSMRSRSKKIGIPLHPSADAPIRRSSDDLYPSANPIPTRDFFRLLPHLALPTCAVDFLCTPPPILPLLTHAAAAAAAFCSGHRQTQFSDTERTLAAKVSRKSSAIGISLHRLGKCGMGARPYYLSA
ncbi:hypothetical protein AXG93_4542s1020 [Marchantia polymorpha subsp. ruderalis]|uniref:Uncharacterized protein n=1 Tax=Marchantia polymorpha subsp. ruderalis TaxID=1480154 RepID=A0A176W210_MARPO|nr:hypothetical protein AXG93_4542s1020 [Marchantia polymorpha subsp. ruderalis]